MKVTRQITCVLLSVIYVCAVAEIDSSNLNNLAQNISGLENINVSSLPKAEDVEKAFREKCEKNGADPNLVDSLKDQQEGVKTCIEQYVNSTQIQAELEKAKETGSMDEVFAKYCKLYPDISACVKNVTEAAQQCMDDKEKVAYNKSMEIVDKLKDFMCFKDGDRMAMFVAEGGVQCLESRKEGIQLCINETVGSRIPSQSELNYGNLPTFLFTPKDCKDFDTIRVCVNLELEQCADSTPANIVDAFFKFLKKQMPCNEEPTLRSETAEESKSPDSGTSLVASTVLTISLLCVRFL